jgi:hypothetical protein
MSIFNSDPFYLISRNRASGACISAAGYDQNDV